MKFDSLKGLTHCGTVDLATPRLVLRRFRAEDAEAVFRNFSGDPETTKYLAWDAHASIYETDAWIAKWVERYPDPAFYRWAIVCEGKVVGSIHFIEPSDRALSCELGFYIGSRYWNLGIVTEAARAVRDFGFAQLGLHKLRSFHFAPNAASGMVLRKLGMLREGVIRDATRMADGRFIDAEEYGLLRADWERI